MSKFREVLGNIVIAASVVAAIYFGFCILMFGAITDFVDTIHFGTITVKSVIFDLLRFFLFGPVVFDVIAIVGAFIGFRIKD